MKTVIDAVNEFGGYWPHAINVLSSWHYTAPRVLSFTSRPICNKEEFINCVDMLIGCPLAFVKWKESKNVKPVTVPTFVDTKIYPEVNYKGVIFQIGKFYQSFGVDNEWFIDKLESINPENNNPFSFGVIRSNNCVEVNQDFIGAVTEAPTVLEDGKAYQFTYDTESSLLLDDVTGIYDSSKVTCMWVKGNAYSITRCTNIQLLEVTK